MVIVTVRGFDAKLIIVALGVGGTIYWQLITINYHSLQNIEDMHAPTRGENNCHHKDFEGYSSAFSYLCNQYHNPTQHSGPAESLTALPYATIFALNQPQSTECIYEGWQGLQACLQAP